MEKKNQTQTHKKTFRPVIPDGLVISPLQKGNKLNTQRVIYLFEQSLCDRLMEKSLLNITIYT